MKRRQVGPAVITGESPHIADWLAIAHGLGWTTEDVQSFAYAMRADTRVVRVDRYRIWTCRPSSFTIAGRVIDTCERNVWRRFDPPASKVVDSTEVREVVAPTTVEPVVTYEIHDCTCGRARSTGVHMRGCALCVDRSAPTRLTRGVPTTPVKPVVAKTVKGGKKRVLPGQVELIKR